MKFLRMKPGHGEVLLAEGDIEVAAEEERLVEAFREQLDQGMWAAVPLTSHDGRRQAQMVKAFDEIPRDADRVIFFPRAAGVVAPQAVVDAGATRPMALPGLLQARRGDLPQQRDDDDGRCAEGEEHR